MEIVKMTKHIAFSEYCVYLFNRIYVWIDEHQAPEHISLEMLFISFFLD